jgi:regulator of sigma E protease
MLLFQLILSLSLLIILHELGHFIPAKLFKTRVEKFYLFFDPYFSLIKKKVGETTYGIGWLPLGGYVKIAGMVDESMDKDQLDKPAEPWEFRSKPAWQRLIIMIGGVVVNIFVGCVIYSAILFTWGRDTLAVENASYGLHCHPIMYQYGFQDGDKIVAIDGVKPAGQEKVNKTILLDDPKSITVMRNNTLLDLQLPPDFGQLLVDSGVKSGCFMARVPFVIQEFAETSGAKTAGLVEGDQIVGINEYRSEYYADLLSQLQKNKDTSVTIHYLRNGESGMLTCTTDAEGKIGVMAVPPATFLNFTHLEYGIGSALTNGASEAWETVTDYASQLRFLFSKKGATQVGGFATFAKLFPKEWDWQIFWERTALISLILAFMNILPIPALDGGHVIFLLWEMITGRAVSQKIMERSQLVGMVLLLGLMLYGNGMDAVRALFGE